MLMCILYGKEQPRDPMYETVRDGNYLNFAKGVSSAEKSLKNGVTTVRDLGCNDDCSIPLAKAVNIGLIKGSHIVPAGSAIQVPMDIVR